MVVRKDERGTALPLATVSTDRPPFTISTRAGGFPSSREPYCFRSPSTICSTDPGRVASLKEAGRSGRRRRRRLVSFLARCGERVFLRGRDRRQCE
jgi:hypothetical protein